MSYLRRINRMACLSRFDRITTVWHCLRKCNTYQEELMSHLILSKPVLCPGPEHQAMNIALEFVGSQVVPMLKHQGRSESRKHKYEQRAHLHASAEARDERSRRKHLFFSPCISSLPRGASKSVSVSHTTKPTMLRTASMSTESVPKVKQATLLTVRKPARSSKTNPRGVW